MEDVTVIIPAFNEAQRIGPTLASYLPVFRGHAKFLVVINGTTDNTAEVVAKASAAFPGMVETVVIPERIGKGGAVREGFKRVHTPWVAYADADNATPAESFRALIDSVLANPAASDGALGSRWLAGAATERSWLRQLIGRCFHYAVRALTGLPFNDTQCGYKVFRTKLIQTVMPYLTVNNMAFDVELLAFLRRAGARLNEVPVVWREMPGRSWPRNFIVTGWDMFKTLLSLRHRLATVKLS